MKKRKKSNNTETVSILGRNLDTSDRKTVGITLNLNDQSWQKSELRDHYFRTPRGKYKVAPSTNIVTMHPPAGTTVVGQLLDLVPETVRPGDKGQGQAVETGISFNWEIL
jgi:hypothetical protein